MDADTLETREEMLHRILARDNANRRLEFSREQLARSTPDMRDFWARQVQLDRSLANRTTQSRLDVH